MLIGEDGAEGEFEVVFQGMGAFLAEGDVTVVDAAAVDFAPSGGRGHENRNFGGDGGVSEGGEALAGVENGAGNCNRGDIELPVVGADDSGGVSRIGIDPEEADAVGDKCALEALDFRNIAIGDGAVRSGEEENDGFGAGRGETIDGLALKVGAEGLSGGGNEG